MLTPFNVKCLINDLDIHFDKSTIQFNNSKGVSLRPKDFGGIQGIEYIDPN